MIEEELQYLDHPPHSFLDKLLWKFTKKEEIEYEVTLSASVFLRMKVFCEDIEELSEMDYSIEDLINALYNDFLYFAKRIADMEKIYTQLTLQHRLLDDYYSITSDNDQEQLQNKRLIYSANQVVSIQEKVTPSFVTIKIGIQRKKALRGEVVLADMEEKYPEHPFSIGLILTILIYDFIGEVKAGNAKTLIERIIKTIERD